MQLSLIALPFDKRRCWTWRLACHQVGVDEAQETLLENGLGGKGIFVSRGVSIKCCTKCHQSAPNLKVIFLVTGDETPCSYSRDWFFSFCALIHCKPQVRECDGLGPRWGRVRNIVPISWCLPCDAAAGGRPLALSLRERRGQRRRKEARRQDRRTVCAKFHSRDESADGPTQEHRDSLIVPTDDTVTNDTDRCDPSIGEDRDDV